MTKNVLEQLFVKEESIVEDSQIIEKLNKFIEDVSKQMIGKNYLIGAKNLI
jgi:hypothetical protein